MSWSKKCSQPNCKGSQKLTHMKCALTQKSKGNWWRCNTCGQDDPEFELEMGDYAEAQKEEYILSWVDDQAHVSTTKFTSLEELNNFMHDGINGGGPLHVIRKSDFALAEVKDVPMMQRTKNNRYTLKFS